MVQPVNTVMTWWYRVTAERSDGAPVGRPVVVEGDGPPDLRAVDELAHSMLEAHRRSCHLVVERLAPEMAELLELAGLAFRVQGKPEGSEQPLGLERLEEQGQLGDPAS
ncbi:MAG: hypothetical protein JWM85_3476 [Acidimicrobiaceae bacterium]|nr:hypothetical protein [Acidimicrobiaceae bacterium]